MKVWQYKERLFSYYTLHQVVVPQIPPVQLEVQAMLQFNFSVFGSSGTGECNITQ